MVCHYIFQYHELLQKGLSKLSLMGLVCNRLLLGLMHVFKGIFRKTNVQSSMALPECMTLTEIVPTTIFSVKIMHDCSEIDMSVSLVRFGK